MERQMKIKTNSRAMNSKINIWPSIIKLIEVVIISSFSERWCRWIVGAFSTSKIIKTRESNMSEGSGPKITMLLIFLSFF